MQKILNLIKSALRNKVIWYLLSRYATFGLQFITSIYIAVKLGAYYFGVWSFFMLLINIGQSCNFGLGNAVNILLVQHKSDEQLCRNYNFNALIGSLFLSIIPLGILVYHKIFGIALFEKYELGNLLLLACLSVMLLYLNSLFMNIFRVKGKLFEVAFGQSVFPVLTLCLMFFGNEKTLLTLLGGGYFVGCLLTTLLYLRHGFSNFSGSFSLACMKDVWKKGFFLFLYNTAFALIVLSTKMIIGRFYSVQDFGRFAFAFSLANAVMLMVDSMLFLIFPKTVDMLSGDDNEKHVEKIQLMRSSYITGVHLLVYIAVPACGVLMYFLPQYKASFPYFVAIVAALMIYPLCFGYNTYLLAQNKENMIAFLALGTLALNLILLPVLLYCCAGIQLKYSCLCMLVIYLLYSIAVNFTGRYYLYGRFMWNFDISWKKLLPIVVLVGLMLADCSAVYYLPLIIFLICNCKSLLDTVRIVLQIIHKPKIVDVSA